jgi:hypothetical protein
VTLSFAVRPTSSQGPISRLLPGNPFEPVVTVYDGNGNLVQANARDGSYSRGRRPATGWW